MIPAMKTDPITKEFEERFKTRYEALHPLIDGRRSPGGRNWLDRVACWEHFAGAFRAYAAENLRTIRGESNLYPELAALVLEAHPENAD